MKRYFILLLVVSYLVEGMEQPSNFENYIQYLPKEITAEIAKEAIKNAIKFSNLDLNTAIYNIRELQMINKEQWYPIINSPQITQFIINQLEASFNDQIENILKKHIYYTMEKSAVRTKFDKKILFASLLATQGAIDWLAQKDITKIALNLLILAELYKGESELVEVAPNVLEDKNAFVSQQLIKHLFTVLQRVAQKIRPSRSSKQLLFPAELTFLVTLMRKDVDKKFLQSLFDLIDADILLKLFVRENVPSELIRLSKSPELLELILKVKSYPNYVPDQIRPITYLLTLEGWHKIPEDLAKKYIKLLVQYGQILNTEEKGRIYVRFGEEFLQSLIGKD